MTFSPKLLNAVGSFRKWYDSWYFRPLISQKTISGLYSEKMENPHAQKARTLPAEWFRGWWPLTVSASFLRADAYYRAKQVNIIASYGTVGWRPKPLTQKDYEVDNLLGAIKSEGICLKGATTGRIQTKYPNFVNGPKSPETVDTSIDTASTPEGVADALQCLLTSHARHNPIRVIPSSNSEESENTLSPDVQEVATLVNLKVIERVSLAQLAEVNYNGYCDTRDWKSFDGKPLPAWADVKPEIQEGWKAGASAMWRRLFKVPHPDTCPKPVEESTATRCS